MRAGVTLAINTLQKDVPTYARNKAKIHALTNAWTGCNVTVAGADEVT